MPLPPSHNRRREERVAKELPMALGAAPAVTRNISPSGMYFESDVPYVVGSEVRFSVDLDTPDGKRVLHCRGEIMRIKPHSGKMGMAVRILDSTIEDPA
jgi:hypothetical protein